MCRVLRVFARGDDGGNHLGVVVDADDLEIQTMQSLATRLGYSETIFLYRGDPTPVRIFTPVAEIPFAGHPLVGAAWMLGRLGEVGEGRIACGIGEVRFRVDGDGARVDVPLSASVAAAPQDAAAAAGVAVGGAWWVDLPYRYLVVETAGAQAVAGADVDLDRLAAAAWSGTYVFAREAGRVKARFFAPALGVPEDPATGSAAVALAAVMLATGRGEGSVIIEQGDEIGAPCHIELDWTEDVATLGGMVCDDGGRRMEL